MNTTKITSPERFLLPRKPFDFRRRPPYPPNLPKPRNLTPQVKDLTVCLAIACDSFVKDIRPKLVLIADQMVSTVTSSSLSHKMWALSDSWYVMLAGTDVTYASNVLTASSQEIHNAQSPTAQDVAQIVKASYYTRRKTQLEDLYLRAYGLSMDDFMRKGRQQLGPSLFETMKFQMDQYDLGFTLLVCGFPNPAASYPVFFEITNPGVVVPRMVPGNYAGIGSGAPNALSYLDWKKQGQTTSLAETIYNGIAAKGLAESALGVGKETMVTILEAAESFPQKALNEKQIQAIRTMWEIEEASARPISLQSRVTEILKPSA
jgi:hypothetical protein